MWARNIFYCITAIRVLAIETLPTQSPSGCIDESPFCVVMATEGECYSEDVSVRSNMHDICRNTCGTCSSRIPSCDNGTETFNNKTNTTCCHLNNTDGNPEFGHSYTEYTVEGVTYRNFSNDSGGCAPIAAAIWWPFIFGGIWWYWLLVVGAAGIAFGLFLAWCMFGQRDEVLDKMLESIGEDSGRVFKKASKMTEEDIATITEHYTMMATMSTFKARKFENKEDEKVTPEGPPETPYNALVAIFKNANLDGSTALDKGDFNMAISSLGVSPTELDISNVFDRLDDGSKKVSVDQLYDRIKGNIENPDTTEDVITVLHAAIITTFVRERRASLSILKTFMAAHKTAGGADSSASEDADEQIDSHRTAGGGLIEAETVYKVIGEPERLRSHEFNALLISMGVPFSENDILSRVMRLEALQPEGIDAAEFITTMKKDLKRNPDSLKSDVIVKVLDDLIAHHGGQEVAKKALKTHHDREVMFTQASTTFYSQWSSDGRDTKFGGDEKLA